jgi:hypothetical protein
MMPKPSRYYVDYEDAELIARELKRHGGEHDLVDPATIVSWEDFDSFEDARTFQQVQNKDGRYACLKERQHLVDESPPGYPEWTCWDSEDEIIEDSA